MERLKRILNKGIKAKRTAPGTADSMSIVLGDTVLFTTTTKMYRADKFAAEAVVGEVLRLIEEMETGRG